uniref:Neprosin PEP catalytic domain-containing protein n=2 Tax=Aegilops tauschii TaxID=37682 RepID=A0A453PW43_AEGTS
MGSGHFASEGFGKAAFIRKIEIADDTVKFATPNRYMVEHGSSDQSKYTTGGFDISKDFGMTIYYGGPGSMRA